MESGAGAPAGAEEESAGVVGAVMFTCAVKGAVEVEVEVAVMGVEVEVMGMVEVAVIGDGGGGGGG